MSISSPLEQFTKQLELKLTLGQHYQQPIQVPAPISEFVSDENDLLGLNLQWTLFQVSAQQSYPCSEQQLATLADDETPFTPSTQGINSLIQSIVQLNQYNFQYEKSAWLNYVLHLIRLQKHAIAPHLVLDVLDVANNDLLLAETLPERSYKLQDLRQDNRLKVAKILRDCLIQQQSMDEEDAKFASLSKGPAERLIQNLSLEHADFIHTHFEMLWKRLGKDQREEWIKKTPFAFFAPHVDYLTALHQKKPEQALGQGLHYLFLHNPEHPYTQKMHELLQNVLEFDAKNRCMIVRMSVELDEQLQQLNIINYTANGNERKTLKALDVEENLIKFSQSSKAEDYLYFILMVMPLSYWQQIFPTWESLLKLKYKNQRNHILDAFCFRCFHEQRADLAEWLYENYQDELESMRFASDLQYLYPLLAAEKRDHLMLQHLRQARKRHEPDFLLDVWKSLPLPASSIGIFSKDLTERLLAEIYLQEEQEYAYLLHPLYEWLVVYGYPTAISPLKDLDSSRFNILNGIAQQKLALLA